MQCFMKISISFIEIWAEHWINSHLCVQTGRQGIYPRAADIDKRDTTIDEIIPSSNASIACFSQALVRSIPIQFQSTSISVTLKGNDFLMWNGWHNFCWKSMRNDHVLVQAYTSSGYHFLLCSKSYDLHLVIVSSPTMSDQNPSLLSIVNEQKLYLLRRTIVWQKMKLDTMQSQPISCYFNS